MLSSSISKDSEQDMSPKARVTYDESKFQVEFDVKNYKPEELSIKIEGDVLVVLAKHEETSDRGKNSYVSKQFEQRFTLPSGVKQESISSSLSKNGVLTITAPREQKKTSITGFSRMKDALDQAPLGGVTRDDPKEGLPHPRVRYDDDKFEISLDCRRYKPEELDVKIEGNTIIITVSQELKEAGGTRTQIYEQKFTLPSGVKSEKVSSTLGRDGVLNITAPRGNLSASSINQTVEERMDRVMSPSLWNDHLGIPPSTRAPSTTSTSINKPTSHFRVGDHERSLFSHSEALDNTDGISKVVYEDNCYKILVNVKNYEAEDLSIKTIGNSVQVEAKHGEKRSDGTSYSSRNFTQTFSLPNGVRPEDVTSGLSRNGILTISAPLPQSRILQGTERLVPIRHY